MATPTLVEKIDKIKSPGLQSQKKTVVVLEAIETTLTEQNTPRSPTGYFAALLSLLHQTNGGGNVNIELSIPIVYLLDVVTPFAPQGLLRSKFTQILGLLAPVLLLRDAEAILLRSSVGCLESLLLAQDSAAWELSVTQVGPRRAVAGLLNLSLDHRPKVRKRAQDAIRKILQNPPPSPSLDHPAADMCAHAAVKNLEELATKALDAKKHHKKSGADAAAHDPTLLHALQMVKTVAAARSGWPGQKIEPLCELLLGIARVGNEYMTVAVFDIFERIFEGLADDIASVKLPRLMEIISDLRPALGDAQLIPPWLAVLARGYEVSAQAEPEETFGKLPELFEMVVPFMRSPSQVVRAAGSECLVSFVAACIPARVILEPSVYDEKVLERVGRIAVSLLSVQYQAAWLETFGLLGAMFDALRWRADPMMSPVVKSIGEIRSNASFKSKQEVDAIIGKAIRAVGPEAVLAVLPLNLTNPSRNQAGRAWMLPILRDHTGNTNLAHFRSELVPLSEAMFQRVLDHGDAEKTMEVKIFETIVQQVWSVLPGYCDLPLDLAAAFDQDFAELLANLLYGQVPLRLDICRGLKNLVTSNKAIADLEGDDDEEDLMLQCRVPRAQARANLEYLGRFSGNMLAVLFNVYTQTLPRSRGPILQTIDAFLGITPESSVLETFARVGQLLAEELKKQPDPAAKKNAGAAKGDQLPPTSNTLMDIIIAIAVHLPRQSFRAVSAIASEVVDREDEPQLQKKAYRLIPRLAESEVGRAALEERSADLQAMLLASSQKVSAPARRERLAAIEALLPFVPDSALHFVPAILSEVVICCKENNERTREAAYDILVAMGRRMESASGTVIDNSKVPHMPADAPNAVASIEEYITMVSAGLAGSTPHMISATVTATSRLVYEFRSSLSAATLADLVQTMDLFLTSNNREIVKSVLGFVKVSVISLPGDIMIPRLSTLIPNLVIWSNEHKAHFKSKVKHIIERMIRKFGFDLVNMSCPEAERKLIASVKRAKERSKKKKEEGAPDRDGTDDDDGSGDEGEDDKRTRKFESEYDEALYSSDSDRSGDERTAAARTSKAKRRGRSEGDAFIVEDEDEPLDLLDRKALANISSTKPVKLRKPAKSKAKYDPHGKLVLGKDSDDEEAGAMDVDKPSGPEESGVGAYVAALRGRDVPRRGRNGKLKFSNRRPKGGDGDDDDDGMDEGDAAAAKARATNPGRGGRPVRGGGGHGGRGARGGRSGKGGIAAGRRGLGEDKRRGPVVHGGVAKGRKGRR